MGRAKFKIIAVTVLAVTGLFTFAAPAQADDASYLQSLRNRMVDGYTTPQQALDIGHFFCKQLRAGRPYNDVYSDVLDYMGYKLGVPNGVVGNYTGASWNNLCREFADVAMNIELDYIPPRLRSPAV